MAQWEYQIVSETTDWGQIHLKDDGEIYYEPNCADDDGDGWCD